MKLKYFFIGILIILTVSAVLIFSKDLFPKNLNLSSLLSRVKTVVPVTKGASLSDEEIKNIPRLTPATVKAVYLTSWSAGSERRINYVINLSKTTKINAVVIDIKDYSGYIAYNTQIPEATLYNARQIKISNIDALVKRFHDENIYTIARIAVFQDPVLARARPDLAIFNKYGISPFWSFFAAISLWFDNLQLAWVDPSSTEVWNYNIAVAKDALAHGFDEVNFDYVRFPSDGDLKAMGFPIWQGDKAKHEVIRDFFREVRRQIPDARISVDLFGLTTTNSDDLGVGQIIEDAYENFDYISPMVYPSHYARGFLGHQNPAEYPYEVVEYSMRKAQERLNNFKKLHETSEKKINAQLRPWLQDFNMGAVYDSSMVRAEIQAVSDALGDNFNGFMMWNASNIYQSEALK